MLISQGVQYGVYGESHFYDWHIDQYSNPTSGEEYGVPDIPLNRKISATLLLSAPDEYEGGDMMFRDGAGNEYHIDKGREQGSIVVFPSNVSHRVCPVTRGIRRSCVSWILGPDGSD